MSHEQTLSKLLSSLYEDLVESDSEKDGFGYVERLKSIYENLIGLEEKLVITFPHLGELESLRDFNFLHYSKGDVGMHQLIKSRIKKLMIEINSDKDSLESKISLNKTQILENIFSKFPRVARQLKDRRKDKEILRSTLEIKDEYDVQDLLRSLLMINFEIVKKEIGTSHYAGGISKMDLVLDAEEIVIEVKMVRKDHTLKTLGNELIIDITRYLKTYSCKFLYFFIYDPHDYLPNLQELVNDIEKTQGEITIKVIFVPPK